MNEEQVAPECREECHHFRRIDGGCEGRCQRLAKDSDAEVLRAATRVYGAEAQLDVLAEECAEVIVARSKLRRRATTETWDQLAEEIADVELMCDQARILLADIGLDNAVDAWKRKKLDRLRGRLAKRAER